MSTITKLSIGKWGIELRGDREKLSQLKVGSLCGVTVKPDQPLLIEDRNYPFVVFPTRVTPTFDLEQTGEGIPCANEKMANDIAQVIQAKNQTVPHVGLMSVPGFFSIATISNVDVTRENFVLFKFHVSKMHNGQRCGFALRLYKTFLDKPRELLWEIMLPTTNARTAQKLFRQKNEEMKVEEIAARQAFAVADAKTKSEPNLSAIQLKVLSKAYPETVAFLAKPDAGNAAAAFAAYQRETLALTGHLTGSLDKVEFAKAAKVLINASRRKNPALNDVEFQLVAGWRLRGYDRMTPQQRFDDLKNIGLQPSSPDAVRKICERLELPSQRKPGERSNLLAPAK
jgi:hypothetical protein